MFNRIHSSTVVVADKSKAVAFYVDKLGWEVRTDNDLGGGYRFVTVAPVGGDAELSLEVPQVTGHEAGGHSGLSLVVDDIDSTIATLLERGVEVVGMEGEAITAAQDMPWGNRGAWFNDLDGNTHFFVQTAT